MPKSIEKDYYIWRLINQKSTSKTEVKKIIKEVKQVSPKIKKAYKKKIGKNPPIKKRHKKSMSAQAKKKLKIRQTLAREIIASEDPFKNWLRQSTVDKIFIFNNVGKSGRKLLNKNISKKLWRDLCMHGAFNSSISKIKNEGLNKIKESFAYVPTSNNKLTYKTLSMIGFYTLEQGKKSIAEQYFHLASSKGQDREQTDRALFWAFMSSKNKWYLREIIKSYDINIYTLLARDFLKLKYPDYNTPSLPKQSLIKQKEITNPIYWTKLKKKIFSKTTNLEKLAQKYKSADTVGFYTYIQTKKSRYKEHYFPMPHQNLLSKLPKSRQAIMYAIARQESRFIPASVSSSYALGMMQIMPFLVDHLSKQRKEKIDYDDMFDPKTSLIYANEHMNYLTKWLQHPLYIAYAYNAGIGFTSRMLRKGKLFANNKGYEPYLSIERLPNSQANIYGKHVLTNYVIYMNKLGVKLRMIDLISTLHIPSKTDKFRK